MPYPARGRSSVGIRSFFYQPSSRWDCKSRSQLLQIWPVFTGSHTRDCSNRGVVPDGIGNPGRNWADKKTTGFLAKTFLLLDMAFNCRRLVLTRGIAQIGASSRWDWQSESQLGPYGAFERPSVWQISGTMFSGMMFSLFKTSCNGCQNVLRASRKVKYDSKISPCLARFK